MSNGYTDSLDRTQVIARILAAIEQSGGTHAEFARSCNVTQSCLSHALRGRYEPPESILKAIGYKRLVVYVPIDEAQP